MKAHAPKMVTMKISNEFIGAVIGPGGKTIQEMQKETETTIVEIYLPERVSAKINKIKIINHVD